MKYAFLSGLASLASVASAADVDTIDIIGNKFFYHSNGSQFYIRGVAYQSNSVGANATSSTSFTDPLADSDKCKRDIEYLQKLNTNVIRTYALNSSVDHSDCMSQLADAGIYVITDLSEPGLSINRNDPTWDTELLSRYTAVVDNMGNYSNVLGFFAGNEVTNAKNNTNAAPFVKAAIRDTKAYIKQNLKRNIPVGYSASDDADIRIPEANYMACGENDVSADFYGVNMYEWCGESSFEDSGYEERTKEMKNMTIPLFFSEYGCNADRPRKFQEVGTLFSDDMTDVWSGGIVYMYFEEENEYGLVSVDGDSVSTLSDFDNLSSAMASISPSSAQASDVTSTATETMDCPATSQSNWVAATELPPTPDSSVCDCIVDSAACQLSSDVDEDDYGDLFGYVCGEDSDACNAILANGTTGDYGAFAGCSPKQQLNYVLNQYYQNNDESSSACDFKGSATVLDDVSTASSCSAYFSAVGSAGTGQISQGSSVDAGTTGGDSKSTATSTGKGSKGSKSSGSGSSKGSSSGSSSKSSSSNAAATKGNVGVATGVFGAFFTLLISVL